MAFDFGLYQVQRFLVNFGDDQLNIAAKLFDSGLPKVSKQNLKPSKLVPEKHLRLSNMCFIDSVWFFENVSQWDAPKYNDTN